MVEVIHSNGVSKFSFNPRSVSEGAENSFHQSKLLVEKARDKRLMTGEIISLSFGRLYDPNAAVVSLVTFANPVNTAVIVSHEKGTIRVNTFISEDEAEVAALAYIEHFEESGIKPESYEYRKYGNGTGDTERFIDEALTEFEKVSSSYPNEQVEILLSDLMRIPL